MTPQQANVFNKPSAWVGLETRYREHLRNPSPRWIMELGVDYGFSLFHIALDFPEALVIGVDPYGVSACHDDAEAWVHAHMDHFPNVEHWKVSGVEAAKVWSELQVKRKVDLLHIDAFHDYESVKADCEAWLPHLVPGATVMLHDVVSYPDGVGRFFNELPGEKFLIPDCHGLGFWYPPIEK